MYLALKRSLIILLFAGMLYAEEGMWLLDTLKPLKLEEKGLQISTDEIWNSEDGGISSAVISLGGCTAAFVSDNGLIATNHHCAFGAIQRNSTGERNLLQNGFLAKSLQDELPTFGTNVYILQSFEDVTGKVLQGTLAKMTPKQRHDKIEANEKKIIDQAEKDDPNISANVVAMNGGMWYVLFKSLRIKDVRLVYAPPQSIGKFGGDIDNFEWPRHTGDYSFLRAYVGPDGKSADPAPENVPYQPQKWLKVSTAGYRQGDFTMVIGYPGGTSRYLPAFQIKYLAEKSYPERIQMLKEHIKLIEERSAENPEVAIKLSSQLAGLNNSLKNAQGQYDGFLRTQIVTVKTAQEKEFVDYLKADPDLQRRYGDILPKMRVLYEENRPDSELMSALFGLRRASSTLSTAYTLCKWVEEKTKKELDREPGFRDKDIERMKERMKFGQRSYDQELEKRALLLYMKKAAEYPIEEIAKITQGKSGTERDAALKTFIDHLYHNTALTNFDKRTQYFDLSKKQLYDLNDPAIAFASKLVTATKPLEDRSEIYNGTMIQLRPRFVEALTQWHGGLLYPDANGTKRLSYGYAHGYAPRDAVEYDHFTTTDGILQKYTGQDPFDSPQKQLQLIRAEDFGRYRDSVSGKMHVNLLTTLDTTGGNSGSPVLNAKGELIGLLFDGNYESIVADYIFDAALTRSIVVDVRYILWLMEKMDGATHLLQEMDIL